jgi:hypothetical protein
MIGPGAERVMTGLTAPAHGLTLVHVRLGRIALSPRRERATPAVDDAPDE